MIKYSNRGASSFEIGQLIGTNLLDGSDILIPLYKNRLLEIKRQTPKAASRKSLSSVKHNTQEILDKRCQFLEIDDSSISSPHCYIWVVQFDDSTIPIVYLKDASLNGVYLNGNRVHRNNVTIIQHDDEIKIQNGVQVKFNQLLLNENFNQRLPLTEIPFNSIQNTDWILSNRTIGVGSFGKVVVGYNKSHPGNLYAVKLINDSQNNPKGRRMMLEEIKILNKLEHINVIKTYDSIINDSTGIIEIYQQLAVGGDLFSYLSMNNSFLKPVMESEGIFIVFQLLKALKYLNSEGIVHRDLKLDNILILDIPKSYPHIVIADFGIAKQYEPDTPINDSKSTLMDSRRRRRSSSSQYVMGKLDPAENSKENGNKRHHKEEELEDIKIFDIRNLRKGSDNQLKWSFPQNKDSIIKTSRNFEPSARNDKTERFFTVIGTPEYAAPEVGLLHVYTTNDKIDNDNSNNNNNNNNSTKRKGYNENCDIWSIGIITHILLSGISPFYIDDKNSLYETSKLVTKLQNTNGDHLDLKLKQWKNISQEGKSFLKGCLAIDPSRRMSVDDCLNHIWIRKDGRCRFLEQVYKSVIQRSKE
ncbi:hypothetical protein B5S33_g2047 [[Candida] boidinii]|nr:hypothetical protein B5S33_g2047 [[Candida] boidinii]